jgi:hypothetical protein
MSQIDAMLESFTGSSLSELVGRLMRNGGRGSPDGPVDGPPGDGEGGSPEPPDSGPPKTKR